MIRRWKQLLNTFRLVFYMIEYGTALFFLPLYRKKAKYKDLWIISERGEDARDNGYYFFRYVREEHPEINIRYIISENSKDRANVEKSGPVITYRSFQHFIALAAAQVCISTHIMGYTPDIYLFLMLDKVFPLRGKKIFLQHGITKDDIPYLYRDNISLDLFVCGAKKEWEYVSANFGHEKNTVQFLGFCRYDGLPDRNVKIAKKKILLMPTWRGYIADRKLSEQEFVKTDFFRCYQSLIKNDLLISLLEKYDCILEFYPHHEMQKYLSCFHSESDRIKMIKAAELEIQPALIEADVLLTDYSSVSFDFAYMHKPVLYYQFDQEKFRSGHYQEGYFKYERDGFGPVCKEESVLLKELSEILLRDCEAAPEYERRMDEFFERRDHNNCKRNYDRIYEIWKQE